MKRLSLAALLAAGTAMPAFAGGFAQPVQDVVVSQPVIVAPAPVLSFAGAYAGGQLGYGRLDVEVDDFDLNDFFSDLNDDQDDDNVIDDIGDFFDNDNGGVYYSAHVGYNWQNDRFVFGPELAVFGGNVDLDQDLDDDFDFGDDDFDLLNDDNDLDLDLNYGARLVGRAGYDFGRTMVYAAAGVAYLDIDLSGDSRNDTGAAYGLGVAYMLNDNVTLGAEYMRHDFNDFDDIDELDIDYDTFGVKASFGF